MVGKSDLPQERIITWMQNGLSYSQIRQLLNMDEFMLSNSRLSMIRKRAGLPPRLPRYDDVIPWTVKDEDARLYPAAMLRVTARLRRGDAITPELMARWESWFSDLKATNMVVNYTRENGWEYVPRQPGDKDIIRQPD